MDDLDNVSKVPASRLIPYSRRQLLKGAAVGVAGVAAASLPILDASPVMAATQGSSGSSKPGAKPAASFSGPTAGTTYRTFAGYDFHAVGSSGSYTFDFPGGLKYVSGDTAIWRDSKVPNGAKITELQYVVSDPAGAGFNSLGLYEMTPATPDQAQVLNATTSGVLSSPTLVSVPVGSPITADTTAHQYLLEANFNNTTQVIHGARIGWILEPGLVSFPDPRRVFGDGTLYSAGAVITNINATQRINGGGPSGIPAGAKSAFAAVMSYQPGVMTLYPGGTSAPVAGNWGVQAPTNFATGIQMLYMLVPLSSSGLFNIRNDFTAKQIFVDVWGYLA